MKEVVFSIWAGRAFLLGLVGLLSFSVLSCQMSAVASGQTEDEIRKLLPGTWHSEVKFRGGKATTEKTFYANGTAKGRILMRGKVSGVSIYAPPVKFTSRWRLEGNKIFIYEMRSEGSDFLDPKEVHEDMILSISRERIDYLNFEGDRSTYHRGPLR